MLERVCGEDVIGLIGRECLKHVIVFGERGDHEEMREMRQGC